MRLNQLRRTAGVTMTELLVVVVVVSLLATIAVPVYTNQAAKARVATTTMEMKEIAEAEQRCAMEFGYYIRFYALNDGFTGDTIPNCSIDSKLGGVADNAYYHSDRPEQIYHRPPEIFLTTDHGLPPSDGKALFARLIQNETAFGWDGPYINWHRDVNQNDWPDDPWGNDYMFFSFDGAIYPPPDKTNPFEYFPDNDTSPIMASQGPEYQVSPASGIGTTVLRRFYTGRVFDRPTVLSLGPNGLPGNGTDAADDGYGKGDDIIYQFGGWKGVYIEQ
ncbi:prepilin-type N-terminal cleavage/methylation domain-containing protein [bacterium]|nr:prepilin-type N-terminal cleavage/methylation domain-containing protein [bacterium]